MALGEVALPKEHFDQLVAQLQAELPRMLWDGEALSVAMGDNGMPKTTLTVRGREHVAYLPTHPRNGVPAFNRAVRMFRDCLAKARAQAA